MVDRGAAMEFIGTLEVFLVSGVREKLSSLLLRGPREEILID